MRRVRAWEAAELRRKNEGEDAIYFHQKDAPESSPLPSPSPSPSP